jgi:hypothetical protein
MDKNTLIGLIIIIGIISIGLFGLNKGKGLGLFAPSNFTIGTNSGNTGNGNSGTEAEKTESKTESKYKGTVSLTYVNRSVDPTQEYITIRAGGNSGNVPITGWTLKSLSSGASVKIPKGTFLFFTGMVNGEQDIVLAPGDNLYLTTGISPNGSSFKVNKCSGYLTQFQTFTPYLNNSCPLAKDEDSASAIPKTVNNDACFDYIDSFPRCRIQTDPLPANWSYECTNFIINKLNYPSCVNAHKNDKDFYQNEWRVYLKRSERLWKDRRETIVLYDSLGKVVDTTTY